MTQRINIQYSVDVDELPKEVGRLLESAFNQYQLLQADCRFTPADSALAYKTVERIDCIRLALASIDHRLNDASNIISGYLEYKAQEGQPQPIDLSREAPAGVDVDDLTEKIDKFKSMMILPEEDEVSD
jgi:hypothetical protein